MSDRDVSRRSALKYFGLLAASAAGREYDHAFAMRDEMYGQIEEILKASGAEILPYEKKNP